MNDKCVPKDSTMDEICEEIENHLIEDVTFSTWNLSKASQKFLQFHYNCSTNTVDWFEEPERLNWAIDNIGTWIAHLFYYLRTPQ